MESRVLAPAKVNLSLLVGPRDEAGYHEVFTVLASVGVYDDLEFRLTAGPAGEVSNEVDVECNTAPGWSNLAARALRALQDFTGWSFNGRVIIRKSIPVGAGLGGGSSDAAAALMAGVEALAEMGGPLPERSSWPPSPVRWAPTCPSSWIRDRRSGAASANCWNLLSCPNSGWHSSSSTPCSRP